MVIREARSDRVDIDAAAKVNLFLKVLGRRPDGYHDIHSLFQAVSLFDRLSFSPTESGEVSINLENQVSLPTGEENLITRAYRLMESEFGLRKGLKVTLEKNIPVAAGLGGGSADGAATILACNLLFGLDLSNTRMAELSLRIGSDLPFFFSSGQALVRGRGNIVEDTAYPIDFWLILVCPKLAVSTATSYAGLRMGLTKPGDSHKFINCRNVAEFIQALRMSGNDFERTHLGSYPVLGRIRDMLLSRGSLLARMSGSGPTMFGVFDKAPELAKDKEFSRGDWQLYEVRPIVFQEGLTDKEGNSFGDHRNPGDLEG